MSAEAGCLRNMAQPKLGQNGENPQPDTYRGEYWVDTTSEDDQGGVHTNSGVANHWYYLLCEGGSGTNDLGDSYSLEGLGVDRATKIVYNSLLHAFPVSATFQDACDGTVLIAQQSYGEAVATVVADTWKAVGVEVSPGIIGGVDDVMISDDADTSDPAYNLQGILVSADYKGLVVKSSRKEIRR